jgi:hypothetical protein
VADVLEAAQFLVQLAGEQAFERVLPGGQAAGDVVQVLAGVVDDASTTPPASLQAAI